MISNEYFIGFDETDKLKAIFNDLFDVTNERIMQAARHGVSEAINRIKAKTISNVASIPYNMTSPTKKYGVPLIEGVKAYMWKGEATGFVDILGNRRQNDGTWMLRFFAGKGAVRRIKYKPESELSRPRPKNFKFKTENRIKGYYSLVNAATSLGSDATQEIQNAIKSAIDEINKS